MRIINFIVSICLLVGFLNVHAMTQQNSTEADPCQYFVLTHENNPQDHYAVLGVVDDATQDQIKTTYRKLVLATHPDKTPQVKALDTSEKSKKLAQQEYAIAYAAAQAKFQSIDSAYNIFYDEDNREQYNLREYARVKEVKQIQVILESIEKEVVLANLIIKSPLPIAGKLYLQDAQKLQQLWRAAIKKEQESLCTRIEIIAHLKKELIENNIELDQNLPEPELITIGIVESIRAQVVKIIENKKEAIKIVESIKNKINDYRRYLSNYSIPSFIPYDLDVAKDAYKKLDDHIKAEKHKENLQAKREKDYQELIVVINDFTSLNSNYLEGFIHPVSMPVTLEDATKLYDQLCGHVEKEKYKEAQILFNDVVDKLKKIQEDKIWYQSLNLDVMLGKYSQLIVDSEKQLSADREFKYKNLTEVQNWSKNRFEVESKALVQARRNIMSRGIAEISTIAMLAGLATSIYYRTK